MKTKTLGYTIERLNREPQHQPTFEETYQLMVERAKLLIKRTKDLFWSLMFNGRKYELMYEDMHMANIRNAMKRKRSKVMYSQWSQANAPKESISETLYLGGCI